LIAQCTFTHRSIHKKVTDHRQTGWPWETYAHPPHLPPIGPKHLHSVTDPLPGRNNPPPRSPTHIPLLRTPSKDQRHSSFRRRHHTHPHSLAIDRFPRRDLRHLYPIWRILQDDSWICLQHSCRGTVPCEGSAKGWRKGRRGKQEQGSACLGDRRACAIRDITRDTSSKPADVVLPSWLERAAHGTIETKRPKTKT
jgi:hypothetical protein